MIELIFVIVILGILASVAIPRLAGTRADAEISSAIGNMRTMMSDIASYYVVTGKFATDISTMTSVAVSNAKNGNDINTATLNAVLGPSGYLKAGGQDCIKFEMYSADTGDKCPAHIQFSIAEGATGVCAQLKNADAVKTYLDARATCNSKNDAGANRTIGGIAIGSSASIY